MHKDYLNWFVDLILEIISYIVEYGKIYMLRIINAALVRELFFAIYSKTH
jgi:hypothetical protein